MFGEEPDATGAQAGGIIAANKGWGLGDKFIQACWSAGKVVMEELEILQ